MPKRIGDSAVELHHFMMPQDANLLGNVHGGIIMKLADEAGALCAMRHARRPTVTVVFDSMTFHDPVRVGDVLNLRAQLIYVGKTSMEVGIEVVAENPLTGQRTHTNSAVAVYVALDETGQPAPVPPLDLVTDDERRRFATGAERQRQRIERAKSERSQQQA